MGFSQLFPIFCPGHFPDISIKKSVDIYNVICYNYKCQGGKEVMKKMIDCIDCEFSRIINGYIHCDWFDDDYEDCPYEEDFEEF